MPFESIFVIRGEHPEYNKFPAVKTTAHAMRRLLNSFAVEILLERDLSVLEGKPFLNKLIKFIGQVIFAQFSKLGYLS